MASWSGLSIQLGGPRGCVGRIKQRQEGIDWSQHEASAGESLQHSYSSSEWSKPGRARIRNNGNATSSRGRGA